MDSTPVDQHIRNALVHEEIELSSTHSTSAIFDNTNAIHSIGANTYRTILLYFLVANLWTLVMTGIPVITEVGPDTYYENHPNWYTGDDVIRFMEPMGGSLLNALVLYKSGIFRSEGKDFGASTLVCISFFIFGLALYGQGAGFHSAAAMFKNSLETLQNVDDDRLDSLHYYMRTVWEHGVSHYLYAAGLAIMQVAQAWAYRSHTYSLSEQTNTADQRYFFLILGLAVLIYAILMVAVILQFPSGTIVGFLFLTLYGCGVIGGYHCYLWRCDHQRKQLEQTAEGLPNRQELKSILSIGRLPVLNYFLYSYLLALFLLVLWIIVVGGFKSRKEAGYN
mmetsp:Transcript_22376/g.37425  ORF Transcript_22376/g.37425 Transcript_22376/m.37425 type:complete len:336 (-) Transcript_22376:180-1187(-)